jgi:hypothetical protein
VSEQLPDATILDLPEDQRPRLRPWVLIPCALLAIVCALVPATSLRGLGAPIWAAIVAGVLAFPALPFAWHAIAERQRVVDRTRPGIAIERFGVRSVVVGLLVLAVSLANLGPRKIAGGLVGLVKPKPGETTALPAPARPKGTPLPPVPAESRHELEAFIPADARAVVALSDPAVMRQLLASAGADTQDKLAALQKCQVIVDRARMLVASRDPDTRLIVVRAPGVTDPRNLYCLAGFLGSERLKLRFTSDKAPVRFEVDGLVPRTLRFTAIDDQTVLAAEGAWSQVDARKPLDPATATVESAPLAAVMARVDRGASLWSAAVFSTPQGPWDLALDARLQGEHLRLRGSSIPPSGEANKAVVETRVPLSFASALPGVALNQGLRGLLALLVPAKGP